MRLQARFAGRTVEIELVQEGGACRFRVDSGQPREAVVTPVDDGVYAVLIGGRSHEVTVSSTGDVVSVNVSGHRLRIEVFDPRDWRTAARSIASAGRQNLRAPMPGKVVRVLVRAGDQVQQGQGLVVIEAMKMQNEMQAPKAGRVIELTVAAGATVAAGEVLAVIE